MPVHAVREIYVVECSRRRVVVSAHDAGKAREIGARLLLGNPQSQRRDALLVREPEEEERTAFETFARSFGVSSECELAAIPM